MIVAMSVLCVATTIKLDDFCRRYAARLAPELKFKDVVNMFVVEELSSLVCKNAYNLAISMLHKSLQR